jgi:hypothetical protein
MTPRIVLIAAVCLMASGCTFGEAIIGPPFDYVQDRAVSQPDGRVDGYPGTPKEIATFPGFPF